MPTEGLGEERVKAAEAKVEQGRIVLGILKESNEALSSRVDELSAENERYRRGLERIAGKDAKGVYWHPAAGPIADAALHPTEETEPGTRGRQVSANPACTCPGGYLCYVHGSPSVEETEPEARS